jgi:methyl-accepting chemotaxis protein
MKKYGLSHIRKWLLLYLALVMLTTAVLYLAVYVEVTSTFSAFELNAQAVSEINTPPKPLISVTGIQLRLLLILTSGIIILTIIGYLWIGLATRQLGRPVRTISHAVSKLAKGQLNNTVAIETSDEFERIGSSINELAANLQELLLYIWKQTGQCLTMLEHIQTHPDMRRDRRLTLESLGYLKQLTESIEDLREMAKVYVFYNVSIEGTKTHAIDEPGKTPSGDTSPKDSDKWLNDNL